MTTPFSCITWNVENLFPPGTLTGPTSSTPVSQQDFDAKLQVLSSLILTHQPDVIALQEIGGAGASDTRSMDGLQSALNGQYPFRAISTHPDSRGIRVAFLSRLELLAPQNFRDFPAGPLSSIADFSGAKTRMGRGALQVEVRLAAGIRIRLVTVHLKSKLLTFPRPGGGTIFSTTDENLLAQAAGIALFRRAAEAVTVRTFLNPLMEGDPTVRTVVLGDLNDDPEAATSQVLLGPVDRDVRSDDQYDHVRLHNITHALPIHGPNFHIFLPPSQRFTRVHEGWPELIDQIMVSKDMLIRPGSDVFTVTEVRSLVELIAGESVGDSPAARAGRATPDHAPVLARFDL